MSTYNTKIGEFCATHSNWEELLAEEPYSILVKRKDGFVIFNYRQLESDFNNEIVRECRGIIFKEGTWEYPVCHAFDKFGNLGESYVPDIDWSSVKVSEKIDGSICKLWFYENKWHVSTNATIDASDAPVPDIRKDDFCQLFWEGITKNLTEHYNGHPCFVPWIDSLNKDFTYIFEMVSPYTRVVIPYVETDVYYLGCRNNITNKQYSCEYGEALAVNMHMFPRPKIYYISDVEQVKKMASELPWDEEGYVCFDDNFNRCKIKSPKYVMAHFARNNNVITRWHLIDIILKGEMEEFKLYASDYADQIDYTKQLMEDFVRFVDACALVARNLRKLSRPEAAEVIKKFHKFVQGIMFMNLDRLVGGKEYTKDWDTYKWERALDNYINFLFRGSENDF